MVLHSNILFRFKGLNPNLVEQKMYKFQYHFKIIIIIIISSSSSSSSSSSIWHTFINMYRI